MGWKRLNMRPPNVTAEEQNVFKLELRGLRRTVRDIRRKRLRYLEQRKRPHSQDVRDWMKINEAVMRRLDFWEGVLIPAGGRQIRSPVRLWDSLNKVRLYAELNEVELNDHIEYYAGKDRQNSRQEAP
jgi:hypothetical protein